VIIKRDSTLTNLGKEHGLYLDTGKKHKTDGSPVRQIKWYDSAIELVKTHLEADFVLGADTTPA